MPADTTTPGAQDGAEEWTPKVGDWLVMKIEPWRNPYGPVQVVTAKQLKASGEFGYTRTIKLDEVGFVGTEVECRDLTQRLKSLRGQHEREVADKVIRYRKAVADAFSRAALLRASAEPAR